MSSTYRAICLSHDPAIEIHGGWENSEWNNTEDAQTAVHNRSGALALHARCDLVIGRYSSPLIQVGCPAGSRHPRSWHPRTTQWVDIGWLRLALAATKTDNPAALKAASEVPGCWLPERVGRLRSLLDAVRAIEPLTYGVDSEDLPEEYVNGWNDGITQMHAALAPKEIRHIEQDND